MRELLVAKLLIAHINNNATGMLNFFKSDHKTNCGTADLSANLF